MRILRVFNNNVVLARDEVGREVILTGRGLGFQRKPGQEVDTARISRRYVPVRSAESVGEVIAGIPPERLALIERCFLEAARELGTTVPSSTILAVVDHLNQAMDRIQQGRVLDYPLRAEVAHLHPEELGLAEQMVDAINAAQDIQLPQGEAIALAMHLFTAAVGAPSVQQAHLQSRLIAQIIELLKAALGESFDEHSINAARFAVHLRYFLVRARTGVQLQDGTASIIADTLRTTHPLAHRLALRVSDLLEMRLGIGVSEDETAYLTMHVARLIGPGAA
ncbi:PRD domain-containing protein [Actinomyces capricornis]|uniref:Transcription antiterminator BglG n=1 Tax=Actinomyces capricornis TaxID=2755559 RepID=A0ABM7UEZ1_9ACTO|nr:PRD domain-containing protein [Actinomyces capricornis]BDA65637.1 transcription antiterminator BglG [Actinomyces capricornis]